MSGNNADDFAQRVYDRVPMYYRVVDAERGWPLLVLLRVVGEQVASIRQDLDALWDNLFIETCDDWVVPYIGALLGTNLLAHPAGQSNRLDVWNTVIWRRSKGTPRMLEALSQAISEWPTDLAEFFQMLGWSQNVNHLRPGAILTPDLRDPYRMSLLGGAVDPCAHAADLKPARPLDQARVSRASPGAGRGSWVTPGRYQIRNVGFFVRRLQPFPVQGATPAAVPPGGVVPPDAACFTFDPLYRDLPLFAEQSRAPITRAAFDRAPWDTFGSDVAVRQFGVLLASNAKPQPVLTNSRIACTFGGKGSGLALDTAAGMRLLEPRRVQLGGAHFVITAEWMQDDGSTKALGSLSTLHAAIRGNQAFRPGEVASGPGRLRLSVLTGRASLGWPGLPASPAARFPGAVVALRAAGTGPVHAADGLYVYLPTSLVTPDGRVSYYVADDGSTYTASDLDAMALARASEGQVYPSRAVSPSTTPADDFIVLNRMPGGVRVVDRGRFGGAGVLMQVELFTGSFQALGAVVTIPQAARDHLDLQVPDPWPAFTYAPSKHAITGDMPSTGDMPPHRLLTVYLKPLSGDFVPPAELVVVNRRGQSLLVYLPEVSGAPPEGIRFFVADDGSTYHVPGDQVAQLDVLHQGSYDGLTLARPAAGQVLPIPGVWPLQQRRPVAINLCRWERNALLEPGELGIDPELGRFALAPHDPAIGQSGFSVDYVEAFSDSVGAMNFDRELDPDAPPTRFVSQWGDADSPLTRILAGSPPGAPVHSSVAAAVAAASDGDVIEILDSATYAEPASITLSTSAVKQLTIRAAAGQRPCLTFYQAQNIPADSSFRVRVAMSRLELNGLLIGGGPLLIETGVAQLRLTACTLVPHTVMIGSLIAIDMNLNERADYRLQRCVTGGLRIGAGVSQLTIADSIVDEQGGFAIAGIAAPASPPVLSPPADASLSPAAGSVQLERVTVLGRIHCDVLNASECLLDDLALVEDRQSGCVRFTRYEKGSALPRRYQCVPTDEQAAACPPAMRCLAPLFNSRRFGCPDYAQLAAACPQDILTASEERAEVGAFAGALNSIRLGNLEIKLQEFMPAGLSAVIIAET